MLATGCADIVRRPGRDQHDPPTAQLSYSPSRSHAPGSGALRCAARDNGNGLSHVLLRGPRVELRQRIAGSADSVTVAVDSLPPGRHAWTCTVTDEHGLRHGAEVATTVTENGAPPSRLQVVRRDGSWHLMQLGVTDPDGDPVQYTVRVIGPVRRAIGPRSTPVDTTLSMPAGRYTVLGITSDGVAATTIRRTVRIADTALTIIAATDSAGALRGALTIADSTGPVVRTPADRVAEDDTSASKSGYDQMQVTGGATSVEADLVDDDGKKRALLDIHLEQSLFGWYYGLKQRLHERFGLAVGVDYAFLNQFASYSTSDRQAASGAFRVFGTWKPVRLAGRTTGAVVFKVENRHGIGSGLTPRQLGWEAGSSVSTAAFKEFGWGVTALYWRQPIAQRRAGLVVGRMDPGDFADAFPLLTPWKSFVSDAYANNPSVALPQQGLGIVGALQLVDHWYVSGGLHDANGSPTSWGFETFFDVREYFTWIETGWNPDPDPLSGAGVHVNLWHQDPLTAAGAPESWGVSFSASRAISERWAPFVRAGYSSGAPALVRWIVGGGVGVTVRASDYLGVATSLSAPPDTGLRSQLTTEAFYRLQLTENLAVTPDLQLTLFPSLTRERDAIAVVGVLRLRFAL